MYSFALMVADLLSLVRQMAFERFVIVANSLGAQIASHYAALFPEGLQALVVAEGMGAPRRRNVATPEERTRHERSRIQNLLEGADTRRCLASLEDAEQRLARNHPRLRGPRLRRIAEAAVEPLADGGYQWRWDPRVQGVWTTNTWELTEQRWSNVGCPTLVLSAELANEYWFRGRAGQSSRPSDADRLAIGRNVSLFPDARHCALAGVGHMIHYDAPERMIGRVDAFFREIGLTD
jgi:pimeloyl-ACP methyl ester carboxylesterase